MKLSSEFHAQKNLKSMPAMIDFSVFDTFHNNYMKLTLRNKKFENETADAYIPQAVDKNL